MFAAPTAVGRAVEGRVSRVGLGQRATHVGDGAAALVVKLRLGPVTTDDVRPGVSVRFEQGVLRMALALFFGQRVGWALGGLANVLVGVPVGPHEAFGALFLAQHEVDLGLRPWGLVNAAREARVSGVCGEAHDGFPFNRGMAMNDEERDALKELLPGSTFFDADVLCPSCGWHFKKGFTDPQGKALRLMPDSVTVCGQCLALVRFDADLKPLVMTDDELKAMPAEDIAGLVQAWKISYLSLLLTGPDPEMKGSKQ